jgi:16S rRNA (guanine527-N7)-methyltransferase
MKLSDRAFKELLQGACFKQDITLNEQQLDKFLLYKNKLLEYNENINLTAITDDEEIIYKHLVDCLEIVKYIEQGARVIDVGTGAGLPGLVIAIYFEGRVNVTLLDSLNKRIVVLDELIKLLELKGVITIHGRAEEIGNLGKYREKFDIATARAVAGLSMLLEYVSPFVKVNGKALLLKGNNIDEEIKESISAENKLSLGERKNYEYSYELNKEKYSRNIIEYKKLKELDKKYPRNAGKIKKEQI